MTGWTQAAPYAAGFLIALSVSGTTAPAPAHAQDAEPDIRETYGLGAILEPEEAVARMPRTARARSYLPELVDLSSRFPPAGDQGQQGSCTGWAVGYAARSYYNSEEDGAGRRLTRTQIPSPAYIYNSVRSKSDSDCDDGAYVSAALDVLRLGALSLADYPYDERRCPLPSNVEKSRATGFLIDGWEYVDPDNVDQTKQEIANGDPVIATVQVTDSFFDIRGRNIWRPKEGEEGVGYHAITITAYNERGQYFKFINSWSRRWGDRGYGRLSYDAFRERIIQAFVMRLPQRPLPPEPEPQPTPQDLGFELPSVTCGKLTVKRDGDRFRIEGFAGDADEIAGVEKAAENHPVDVDITLRPWPQCETLMTMDEVLTRPDKPEIALPQTVYESGDTLSFDVAMPAFQGYLHVAYIQADGNVVNLVQSSPTTLQTRPPNERLTFGDGREGRPRFTVGEPFGEEMILVIASKSPLFDKSRPKVEVERDFLTALRTAIFARPTRRSDDRVVTADFAVLRTEKKE